MSNLMEIIGEKTIIDTILHLLIHLLYRIESDGESMRRNRLNLLNHQSMKILRKTQFQVSSGELHFCATGEKKQLKNDNYG